MKPTLLHAAALLALLPAAHAEDATHSLQVQIERTHDAETRRVWLGEGALDFAGRELEGGSVVKGAPYCATAVHESVQTLTDGNRIVRKQSTQLCRDGEGRTRRELQREGGKPSVYLHDPVAKESWLLDPEKKTARRIGMSSFVWHSAGTGAAAAAEAQREVHLALSERMRDNAERWREWAGQVAEKARGQARGAEKAAAEARLKALQAEASARGDPAVVVENEIVLRAPGASEPERRREVRVIRMSDFPQPGALPPMPPVPPVPPVPPLAGLPGGFSVFTAPRGGGVTTALPAKDIDGVKVNGERTTWTVEAGKIGNEKPIVSTREVWRSPELMLTVQIKESDPRSGETQYRLEHLKRGEPDPALMKVPADYQAISPSPRTPKAPATPVTPATPATPAAPPAPKG